MSMAVGMQVSKLKKKNQYVRENERLNSCDKVNVSKRVNMLVSKYVNESICRSVSMQTSQYVGQ